MDSGKTYTLTDRERLFILSWAAAAAGESFLEEGDHEEIALVEKLGGRFTKYGVEIPADLRSLEEIE